MFMAAIVRQFYLDDTRRDGYTGTHTFRWRYSKDSSGSGGSDCIWVDHIEWIPTVTNWLADAVDSSLTYTTGGTWWYRQYSTYCYGGDAAQSGDDVEDSEESWMQTTVSVQTEGSLTFYWKVSSQSNCDWLEFYIDAVRQDRISGTVDWQPKSYTITTAGSHTLKWRYVKDGSGSAGSDCGWGVNGGSSCIRNHPFRGELEFRRHLATFGLAFVFFVVKRRGFPPPVRSRAGPSRGQGLCGREDLDVHFSRASSWRHISSWLGSESRSAARWRCSTASCGLCR